MKLLYVLPLLLATPVLAQTPATFAAQTTFTTGPSSSPVSVAAADMNGDGKPDVLVANFLSSNVGVLLNTTATGATTASFGPQAIFVSGSGSFPISVAAADVNGDGKPDLLVANRNDSRVGVLLNTTTPGAATVSLATQTTFVTGNTPVSLAVADVNGDGRPDVLTANQGSGTVSVLLNTTAPGAATASFAAQASFTTGTVPVSVAAADVNGDGKPDLLVANSQSNNVVVLLNTTATGATTASFAARAIFAPGTPPASVTGADVNADNKPDLLVVYSSSNNSVGVLLNTTATGATTASFGPQGNLTTGTTPYSVVAADVNGDSKPDLLVPNYGSSNVGVLLNATAPGAAMVSFAAQLTYPTGSSPTSVAVADVNGDRRPDLIVANYGGNTVGVLLNTGTYTPLPTRAALPGTAATLYPNPAHGSATLTATGLPAAATQLAAVLLNPLGQEVHRLLVPATAGAATATVPTSGLAAGLYLLRLDAVGAQGAALGALPTQRLSVAE